MIVRWLDNIVKQMLVAAVMCGCLPTMVIAAHPLITDDTATQGRTRYQLEMNSEYEYDREDETTEKGSITSICPSVLRMSLCVPAEQH